MMQLRGHTMVAFVNPPTVHTPGGAYSHSAVVPTGTELVFIAGQVGVRPDGTLPESVAAQADQVFANLTAVLAFHGLDVGSLIKLTMFIVAGRDIQAVRDARAKYLGSHRPASTAVFVSQLVDPAWHVEVEAVAAKPKA
jgi:enamine deaminase RidA (YjgF/YER057c/UK114 family)